MKEVVVVSVARTPIGKAYRGAFNNIKSPTLVASAVRAAVSKAGVEAAEIEDLVIGTALQCGTSGWNLGRTAAQQAPALSLHPVA